ncbi:MAG: V-type ATPase subunit [Clostridiales bacterium]|nr:V-type ATPase subunit [Clostridiales bacterium]
MAKKNKDTDYLFLSARIRSLERSLLTSSRMDRMLAAADAAEAAKVLAEIGYEEFNPASEAELNQALLKEREKLFAELYRFAPDAGVIDVFKIKYDYHNLKTIIKARGTDASRLLVDAGRIPADELLKKYTDSGSWDFLPEAMRRAATEASDVLAETFDPQRSDFILDRAYFTEMLAAAEATKCGYLLRYVRATIDAANLRSIVRTLRMNRGLDFLKLVLFPGGTVPVDGIVHAAAGGNMLELYHSTVLRAAAEAGETACKGGSLTEFEKLCDDAVLHQVATAKQVPFGPEVLIAYVAAKETEFTAVRIIMAGRIAGLNADVIRERLRESYV